jgi:hypothetical protein
MSLDQRITEYATLIALVLVLLTLFTSQRASRLEAITNDPDKTEDQAKKEKWLDGVIIVVTALLFATGLPLLIESIEHFHPRADSGPLRGGFSITWLLLIALIIWQVQLWRAARQLHKDIKTGLPLPAPADPGTAVGGG